MHVGSQHFPAAPQDRRNHGVHLIRVLTEERVHGRKTFGNPRAVVQ